MWRIVGGNKKEGEVESDQSKQAFSDESTWISLLTNSTNPSRDNKKIFPNGTIWSNTNSVMNMTMP